MFSLHRRFKIGALLLLGLPVACAHVSPEKDPKVGTPDLVAIQDIDPSIIQEIRYAGIHNFLGRPVRGYNAPKCILSRKAAQALSQVQTELKTFSLSLKVYDCYRPQKAVNDFIAWASDARDTKMKKEFYPVLNKDVLFSSGYISVKSGHSRGSTMDLTVVSLPLAKQDTYKEGDKLHECTSPKRFKDNGLDMGTGYDCLDPLANTANPGIGSVAKINRLLLKSTMEKFGFKYYEKEWWHFTLKEEPYADQYFDLDIN